MRRSLSLFVLLLVGCTPNSSATDRTFHGVPPIKAVATTGMIGDLVRNVGGARVQVTDLFKPGVDPHTYRANSDDLAVLQSADIIFANGFHLEGKLGSVLEQMNRRKPSIQLAEATFSSGAKGDEPRAKRILMDDEHPDPHIWFDVALWSDLATRTGDELAKFDPKGASEYKANAAAYVKKLLALDAEVRDAIKEIPKDRRVLVTSHDAFRYFGQAYDVDVRGIQGVSTESEASLKHINELVDFLAKSKVKAVFVESSVSPRNMEAVIQGCKQRGHDISKGGELFSDAMGDPGTPEGTYEGMIRHNVKTVVNALK